MKTWYQSKTIIVGIVTSVVSILALLQGQDVIKENPELVAALGTVLGVLNIILRFLTDKPVQLK